MRPGGIEMGTGGQRNRYALSCTASAAAVPEPSLLSNCQQWGALGGDRNPKREAQVRALNRVAHASW